MRYRKVSTAKWSVRPAHEWDGQTLPGRNFHPGVPVNMGENHGKMRLGCVYIGIYIYIYIIL